MQQGGFRARLASGLLVVAIVAGVLAALPRPAAAATTGTITSSGPLTKIVTSTDLNCAVNYTNDTHAEFYNDTGCGTFVAIGATVFGPASVPSGPSYPGTANYKKFTPVSQTAVSGAGTAANPYKVVTVVDAGTTKIRITQTDTYVVGDKSYRTDIAIENKGLSSTNLGLYRAGNCYTNDNDNGFGAIDSTTGGIACVGASMGNDGSRTPNGHVLQWVPITAGSRFFEASAAGVWSAVLARTPFANTCQCSTYQDNGSGLSWSMTLAALASATRSQSLAFSGLPKTLNTTKTADASQVTPGALDGYTIRFDNPNNSGATLTTITDDLPAGFTYAPHTTTGLTTADPVVTNGGRHLQWSGSFGVASGGSAQMHFRVTASTTPGDYFNNAGGTASGNVTVNPTGDTAVVRVLGSTELDIVADRSTAAAGPTNAPSTDVPLQPMSPAAQAAPLVKLDVLGSPLVKLDVLGSSLVKLNVLGSPLLKLDLLGSSLLKLDLLGSPLGFEPLGNSNDLGGSALVRAGLAQMPLSTLPVIHGDDWPTRLAGTGLSGPLETITFGDVLASNISHDNMPSLSDLDLTVGPLGRLSSISLYMGDTRLTAIGGVDWCGELERLGYTDCGAALGAPGSNAKGRSASLLSLEISGVALDNIAGLKSVHLSDVAFPDGGAVLPLVLLRSIDLSTSDFGGILARNAQNVVDCTKVDCSPTSTKNLYNAQQLGALNSDAAVGSLGAAAASIPLVEAALGIAASNGAEEFYNLSPSELGLLGYGGSSPQDVHYTVTFTGPTTINHPVVTVTLPSQFRYVPGTSAVTLGGAAMTGAPTPQAADEIVTWDFGATPIPAGQRLVITFAGRPGLILGPVNATVVVAGTGFTSNAATPTPLIVTENYESGDTVSSASPIEPGRLYFGHISHPGDIDAYSFPAPAPGSTIKVALTQGDTDSDLVVYHPANAKAHDALRPPAALPPIQATIDRPMTLGNQGEPLDPAALDDIPIANLPVAGVSANRGLNFDSVEALSWDAPAGARYTVQVSGYNGAVGVAAYGLRVSITPAAAPLPIGNARVFPNDGNNPTLDTPPVPSSWAGTNALIIADRQRLRRAYGNVRADVALSALSRLEGAGIGARTLFVDAFPEVNAAFAALDARPSDPELSNNVVRAINARVDQTLGAARSGLQYMVLVGTDEVMPMARVPDLTGLANERAFAQELLDLASATGGNDALLGAAALGMITTDDAYGAYAPTPFLGSYLYQPDVSLGRLVETPEDIDAVVTQFLTPVPGSGDGPGVLRPTKSLVTGYDFMTALANEVKSALDTDVTPGQVASLINETWTRTDLENAFPKAATIPDIISANAHYSPDALLPANGSNGLFTTDEFGGPTPPNIPGRILFQMGCHSGFSISNYLSSSGDAPEWPEQMLRRGAAAFIGQTGFGIGLRSTVAFSARITADFAHNMAHMPLGTALAQAKRDYLGGGKPNVYDYKVMAEATYFGLPMFHLPGATGGPTPAPPRATTTDAPTGLTAVDISTSNPVSSAGWELINNGEGSYWQLAPSRLLTVAPNRPIEPKVLFDVTQPGLEARGAVLTKLQSVAQTGFNPALARVVVGEAANEPESQSGDVLFPTAQQSTTRTLTPGGARDQLVLTLGHFESTNTSGNVTGIQTRFTKMDARVLFSPSSNLDHTPPLFQTVSALKDGSVASFRVLASDPDGGTVRDVSVLFNDGGSADWTFRHLALAADGAWVGGFPVTGTNIQFIAQAVDAAGNVGLTTNKGDFFDYLNRAAGTPTVAAAVSGTTANGWYSDNSTVTLTGPDGSTFAVSDNGGPVSLWSSGQPIPVSGPGVHTLHWELTGSGVSGDVTVPIDTALPTITGARTTAANSAGWYNGPVTVHFTCSDAESGVATCEPDRTLTSDGTGQSVTGRATDNVGNTNTITVDGINIDTTVPAIGGAPTTSPNAAGWYAGPVTVHFTCTDERSGIAQCPADQILSTQGANQSVSGTAIDAAGNSTSFTVSGINIDSTPPGLTGTPDHAPNTNGWYRDSVTVNFACTDTGGSGVPTCAAPQTLSSDGANQSVTATVTDRAGNSTTTTVSGINIDKTLPTVTGSVDRPANSYGWYNAAVVVSFSCSDALSGIDWCNTPITLATEGSNQSVTGSAFDKAGNTGSATVGGLNIDRTAPTITATPNDSTWRKGPVTVHFTCGDDRSGVVSCPADVVVSATGATSVTRSVTDKAGNTSSVTTTVRIDNGLPTSAFNNTGLIVVLPNGNINGTAADDLSGIASLTVKFVNTVTNSSQTTAATASCAEPRTSCTWTVKAPAVVGSYRATSVAVDRAGNLQNPGTVRDVRVLS